MAGAPAAAVRGAVGPGSRLRCRRRPRRFAFLQILQHQLELLDLGVELLRRAPELHPPQLGELGFVLFDL